MPLIRHPTTGNLLRADSGLLAFSLSCCCDQGGCCPGQLISGSTVLQAELTADSTGCFTVGSTMCMDDLTSPLIWTSASCYGAGFFDASCWRGITLVCTVNNILGLNWDGTGGCPLHDNSPTGMWQWNLLSGSCDPFEFIFDYNINEDVGFIPGCNCDCSTSIPGTVIGNVTVKITILP